MPPVAFYVEEHSETAVWLVERLSDEHDAVVEHPLPRLLRKSSTRRSKLTRPANGLSTHINIASQPREPRKIGTSALGSVLENVRWIPIPVAGRVGGEDATLIEAKRLACRRSASRALVARPVRVPRRERTEMTRLLAGTARLRTAVRQLPPI